LPLVAANLLPAIEILSKTMFLLASRCISGIEAIPENCLTHLHAGVSIITALAPLIGYDRAAELAKQALHTNLSIKDVLHNAGLFDDATLNSLLSPECLTRPGMAGGNTNKD
jgi:aspartate ammonia-lyase